MWKCVGSKTDEIQDHDIKFWHLDEKHFDSAKTYLSTESVSFDNCDVSECVCVKCYLDY